jgi:hypothetical protein
MLNRSFTEQYVVPSATKTATGNDTGQALGGAFNNIALYVNVTAASGTTPTLVVKLQDSPDGTNWYDITGATTASLTTTGAVAVRTTVACGHSIRAVWTIGGTTPSFTFSVNAVLSAA